MGFEIFGMGVPEMVAIAVVALIFLGPERLPEVARTAGKWVREFRSLTGEATSIWRETLDVGDTVKDSMRIDLSTGTGSTLTIPPPSTAPTPPLPITFVPAPPAPIAYTPPGAAVDGSGEEAPGALAYPAPFAAPAPAPPRAEPLDYPAPFTG